MAYSSKNTHKIALESAIRTSGFNGALPKPVETAFRDYAQAVAVSKRAFNKAELKLDNALAASVNVLGGWDTINRLRNAYKAALDKPLMEAVDEAHSVALKAAHKDLSEFAPSTIIPDEMARALKDIAKSELFPGHFLNPNAKTTGEKILAESQTKFALPDDDGMSLAHARSHLAYTTYLRTLKRIVSRNRSADLG